MTNVQVLSFSFFEEKTRHIWPVFEICMKHPHSSFVVNTAANGQLSAE
jgi:hypothetical protein